MRHTKIHIYAHAHTQTHTHSYTQELTQHGFSYHDVCWLRGVSSPLLPPPVHTACWSHCDSGNQSVWPCSSVWRRDGIYHRSPLCFPAWGVLRGVRDYPSPQLRRFLRHKCSSSLTRVPKQKQESGGGVWLVSPGSLSRVSRPLSLAQSLPSALGHGQPCWPHRVLFKDTLFLIPPCLILLPES